MEVVHMNPPEDEDWRGRVILSGLFKDPCNWFMSAVADPETDFDYRSERGEGSTTG